MKESRPSPEDLRRGGRLLERDDRSDCTDRLGDAVEAVDADRAGEGVVAAATAEREGDDGGVACKSSVGVMLPVPSSAPSPSDEDPSPPPPNACARLDGEY